MVYQHIIKSYIQQIILLKFQEILRVKTLFRNDTFVCNKSSLTSAQNQTTSSRRLSIQAVNICGQDTLRSWRRECSGYLLVPWNTPTAVGDGPRGARVLKPSRLRGYHESMNLLKKRQHFVATIHTFW